MVKYILSYDILRRIDGTKKQIGLTRMAKLECEEEVVSKKTSFALFIKNDYQIYE